MCQQWAMDLWDRGYQPVLVPLMEKSPRIPWKRWQTERVPRDLVETWFSHGEHNIALISGAVSGTVVVDADSQAAVEYLQDFLPPTMRVLTSKGAHFYFRHPGGRVPNSVRALDDPPVDLRGDGGLTIGPGSVHRSGHRYVLEADCEAPWTVAELPVYRREWFPGAEQAREREFAHPTLNFRQAEATAAYRAAQAYAQATPGAVQGSGGDAHTYVLACRLVRGFNLTDEEALEILRAWNASCMPPWRDEDLSSKVRHARAYGSQDFGSMLAQAQPGGFLWFR